MGDNGGQKILPYNVGGQIFEVVHDIVMRHPTTIMAKVALKFSPTSPTAAITIAGNAEQFGYVLDYLCTGCAVLPFNIFKSAFL